MINEDSIEEMDLDNMSTDELDRFLSETEAGTVSEPEPIDDSGSVEEEDVETSTDNVEEQEVEPEPEEVKPDNDLEDENIPPQYRGKTKKDFLDMQLHANSKISKQENEIYHLQQKLKEIQEQQQQVSQKSVKVEEDDVFSKYEQEDLNTIRKLVQLELEEKNRIVMEQTEQQRKAIAQEHDEIWENLKIFNPALFNDIEKDAIEEMKSSADSTYFRKGWLKDYISTKAQSYMENGSSSKKDSKAAVKRKVAASTVGGSSSGIASKKINKNIDDMTASEYEKYLETQGYNI